MKERMVTRTVNTYEFTVMVADITSGKVDNKVFTYGVDYVPEKGIDQLRKRYDTPTEKLVAIIDQHKKEVLRGMSEVYFIKNAELLPPRGTAGRTRERMVTRTVNTYEFTVMVADITSGKVENKVYTYGVDYVPEKGIDQLRKRYDTSTEKLVAIIDQRLDEKLYGMSEQKFIQLSVEMPPRVAENSEN